jgi:hypothetical protein
MTQLTVPPLGQVRTQHPQLTDAEKTLAEIYKKVTSGIDRAILIAQCTETLVELADKDFPDQCKTHRKENFNVVKADDSLILAA